MSCMSATSCSSGVKWCTDIQTICPNEVITLSTLQRVFVHGKQTCITGQACLGRELNTTAKVEPDQAQKGPYVGCKATHAGQLFSSQLSRLQFVRKKKAESHRTSSWIKKLHYGIGWLLSFKKQKGLYVAINVLFYWLIWWVYKRLNDLTVSPAQLETYKYS